MPIYGYQCSSCGHQKDILQKIADAPVTTCPACGEEQFARQVSAPNFQLKGTGWYVTDFRDGNQGKKGDGKAADGSDASGDTKADGKSDSKSDSTGAGESGSAGAASSGGSASDGGGASSSDAKPAGAGSSGGSASSPAPGAAG